MGRGDTSLRGNAYICRRINKGSMKQLEWEGKIGLTYTDIGRHI